MGSCLLNILLVRVKLLIWWDFCRSFKVLLEQLLKFLLKRQYYRYLKTFGLHVEHEGSFTAEEAIL